MNIDWSRAPEGAEYWCELQWFKTIDGEWRAWCPGVNSWVKPAYAAPDNFSWWGNAIKRPASWNGEGLPPAGTVCEFREKEGSFVGSSFSEWAKCEVIATTRAYAIIRHISSAHSEIHECSHLLSLMEFRPIRTPEQIAAEEREKAVIEMLGLDPLGGSRRGLAEALYDHGYRKQEQTK